MCMTLQLTAAIAQGLRTNSSTLAMFAAIPPR